tara:strand:+ start:29 stop:208 length:180 start_codon:yes stop_codon:yes gene_type:complete
VEDLINISNKDIANMPNEILHQKFLQIRFEINKLKKIKKRSIELEILYCYFVKEIEERA